MSEIDNLPLRFKYPADICCQHLNDKGEVCLNRAEIECYIFEEGNEGKFREFWSISYFCNEHAKLRGKIPVDEVTNLN